MKLHRHARTTPAARALLVQRVIHEQWTQAEVAEGSGISVRTVAKWVRRYRHGGSAALEDRSSRPGAPRHQTAAKVVARIRHLRETKHWPAWRISRGQEVGLPVGQGRRRRPEGGVDLLVDPLRGGVVAEEPDRRSHHCGDSGEGQREAGAQVGTQVPSHGRTHLARRPHGRRRV